MGMELPQLLWLVGMSVFGGLLGWIHRRIGKPKSFEYAIDAVFTSVFIGLVSCEILRSITRSDNLSIMIGGALAYYSDYVLELGKKIIERKSEKL